MPSYFINYPFADIPTLRLPLWDMGLILIELCRSRMIWLEIDEQTFDSTIIYSSVVESSDL